MESHPYERQDNYDVFAARYARDRSAAARDLERRVLGHEAGVNGYTTVSEADVLEHLLPLEPRQRLLDLGAGRGWPGAYVARNAAIRLVSTDLPRDGLVTALGAGTERPGPFVHHGVSSDGRALPFANGCFAGVVHSDVFC